MGSKALKHFCVRSIGRVFSANLALIACLFVPNSLVADEALLDYVELKQRQSREQLARFETQYAVSMEVETSANGVRHAMNKQMDVHETRDGARMRIESRIENSGVAQADAGSEPYAFDTRAAAFMAMNEREAAYWEDMARRPDNELTIWRHSDPEDIHRDARGSVYNSRSVNMLDYVFGLQHRVSRKPGDIATVRAARSGKGDFDAQKVVRGGKEVIEVTYERDGRIIMTATIDPDRGYATTKLIWDSTDGLGGYGSFFESTVSVAEIEPGVWAPASASLQQHLNYKGSNTRSSVRFEAKSSRRPDEIDPEIFQWTSLGYTGDYVHLVDEAGDSTLLIQKGDRLKPAPLTDEAQFKFTPKVLVK